MKTRTSDFSNVKLDGIDVSELVDRKDIKIDPSLPREQRQREYIRQTNGHPDCVIIEGVIVINRYSKSGLTIEDCLCAAIRNA